MKKTKTPKISWLRSPTVRVTRAHFFYVIAYSGFVLEYDAWKLVTPKAALGRWTVAGVLMVVTTICWYLARQLKSADGYYQSILAALIAVDIYVASYTVFVGRGMASRGVALFAIPIIIAAVISRTAVFATAALSLAAYWFSAIRYFDLYPSEGYRVELYSDLTFYGATFFILAALLWIVMSRTKTAD